MLADDVVKIIRLIAAVISSWLSGLAVIALALYASNDGSDFTLTDISGFGVLFLIVSALLIVVFYLPALLWLENKTGAAQPVWSPFLTGVVLNIPTFLVLAFLIGRRMVASEALWLMVTFLISGLVFGSVWAQVGRVRS